MTVGETPHEEMGTHFSHSSRNSMNAHRGTMRSRWLQALLAVALIAAVAIGSLVVVHQASAATYTVCASGCPYTSINTALTNASSGATIKVGPGTYGPGTSDSPINITKPVNLVGAGAGHSIINGAPAPGTAIGGVVAITTPSTPGNITVSGFTIEGAIVNDSNDDGLLMTITDHNASDVITVKNNQFYGDTTLDPQLLADQTDSIYVANNDATVKVTNNSFKGVFRAVLIEGNPGPFSFTGNTLNLHALYDTSTTPPSMYFWAEGLLFLADNSKTVTSSQVVSGNTFENYLGLGVGVDAGYGGGLVGRINHLSITSNTFNNVGVATPDSPPFDAADIYLHGFGTTNGSVVSAITGVSIKYNTFNVSSTTGHGYAISFKGSVEGNNVIDHNLLRGSGSSRPLAGVNFVSPTSTTGVSITRNVITGFVDGLHSDALLSGAHVSATQNCISSNSHSGATVAAGVNLAADHNWWGAASGPHATTNASGTGNAVNGSVTFTPFLTAPASICAGPVAKSLYTSVAPAPSNTGFSFNATLSDSTTGNFVVKSAQYSLNGGSYKTMSAKDGTFNQVTEGVRVYLGGLAAGKYTLCVRGKDAAGYTGSPACIALTVYNLAATQTANASATQAANATPTTPGVPTDTATTEQPTATTTGNSAGNPTPTPTSVGFVGIGGFSTVQCLIGAAVLLLILGVILFLLVSRRRRQNEDAYIQERPGQRRL